VTRRLLPQRFPNEIFKKFPLDNFTHITYGVYHILYFTQCVVNMDNEIFENLRLELRRGSLILAVLAQLRTEHYGYALRKALESHGLAIDENTLYPLLRRLETQGLLVSHWREEDKRNKRFYRLSPQGEIVLYQLLNENEAMHAAIDRIMARIMEPSPSPQAGPQTALDPTALEPKEQLQ
jgi:PadR family transcriptional regulator, regulatory protein PadR